MKVSLRLVMALVAVTVTGAGCSSSGTAISADPSATPSGSEGQLFPNDDQSIDPAVEQLDFVVAALVDYASPTVGIRVGGRQVQTYAQGDTAAPAPYAQDQQTLAATAADCIMDQLEAAPNRPAVVMDIDETVLSNLWTFLEQPNLVANKDVRLEAASLAGDPAIEATKELFQQVRAANAAVVLISGRPESYRRATTRNLRRAGLGGYEKVVLAVDDSTLSAGEYKTQARQQLRDAGWTLVGNIGDQFSDLNGSSGSPDVPCSYKLPNPYYFIPW